jgi:hypothetical protein
MAIAVQKNQRDWLKASKNTIPMNADFREGSRVVIGDPGDFVRLLGNKTLFTASGVFFFLDGGVCYETNTHNLAWNKFHRMVEKGFGDLRSTLNFTESTTDDPNGLAEEAWAEREVEVRTRYGNHALLTAEWCANSDFSSREVLEKAAEAGFLTARDMRVAKKKKHKNGPIYYFAKKYGFKSAKASKAALALGTDSPEMLRIVRKGKFNDLHTATNASNAGFTQVADWEEANERGCSSMKELEALRKHGWATVMEYNSAMQMGFKDEEHKLYVQLSTKPSNKKIWTSVQDWNAGRPQFANNILDVIRENPKVLKVKETHGLDLFWQAAIIHLIEPLGDGKTESLEVIKNHVAALVLKNEKMDDKSFQEFIYHHPKVHEFGSAVPADKVFSRRITRDAE